jgi:peptidoglycan/LPS O-acetylase OafA/YrhL
MPPKETRFEVLDAWRGICAVLVAMFHLQAYSHFYELSLLRHSFLFVDFFFVLSGFVITASYRTRLLSGFSFWNFMLLRWGRLYPLHVAILAAFIAIEFLRYRYSGLLGGGISERFSGSRSISAIVTNLFLIQSLGIHNTLTWNLPSWSISVEFYTYAIFALALQCLRRRFYIFVGFMILVGPIFLLKYVGQIDTDYDFGIVRCLFGFFVGVAVYDLYLLVKQLDVSQSVLKMISLIEISCVGIVGLFVCFWAHGPLSVAGPLVFGLTVIVFSFEGGVVSRILKAPPFLFLGTLSYSIYMVHALVLVGMGYAFQMAEREFGIVLFNHDYFGAEMWQGDIFYCLFIFLIVSVAYLTYIFIETPGRTQLRRAANRIFGASKTSKLAENLVCRDRPVASDNKSTQTVHQTPAETI